MSIRLREIGVSRLCSSHQATPLTASPKKMLM
jgi:hypothetical protein